AALAAGFALANLAILVAVRPTWRAALGICACVAAVAFWWLRIPPRHDRDWLPDVARTAHATFDGSRVTVENVRNFVYRGDGDYDEHWETRTIDLDHVTGANLFLSFWG